MRTLRCASLCRDWGSRLASRQVSWAHEIFCASFFVWRAVFPERKIPLQYAWKQSYSSIHPVTPHIFRKCLLGARHSGTREVLVNPTDTVPTKFELNMSGKETVWVITSLNHVRKREAVGASLTQHCESEMRVDKGLCLRPCLTCLEGQVIGTCLLVFTVGIYRELIGAGSVTLT